MRITNSIFIISFLFSYMSFHVYFYIFRNVIWTYFGYPFNLLYYIYLFIFFPLAFPVYSTFFYPSFFTSFFIFYLSVSTYPELSIWIEYIFWFGILKTWFFYSLDTRTNKHNTYIVHTILYVLHCRVGDGFESRINTAS